MCRSKPAICSQIMFLSVFRTLRNTSSISLCLLFNPLVLNLSSAISAQAPCSFMHTFLVESTLRTHPKVKVAAASSEGSRDQTSRTTPGTTWQIGTGWAAAADEVVGLWLLPAHVSRLTSHVSRLTSHVSRLTSHRSPCSRRSTGAHSRRDAA